jgi:transposase-like protein
MASKKKDVGSVASLRYWQAEDARAVVEAWKESGERLSAFARRHSIKPRSLSQWATRLEAASEAISFHPVQVVEAPPRERAQRDVLGRVLLPATKVLSLVLSPPHGQDRRPYGGPRLPPRPGPPVRALRSQASEALHPPPAQDRHRRAAHPPPGLPIRSATRRPLLFSGLMASQRRADRDIMKPPSQPRRPW